MTESIRRGARHLPDANEAQGDVDVRMPYRGVSYVSINLPEDPKPVSADLCDRSAPYTGNFLTGTTLLAGPDTESTGFALPAE